MKIYYLTPLGSAIASNPSHSNTLPIKVLYKLRRRGGQGSDEWLSDQLGVGGNELQNALKTLQENNAIRVVGG